MQLTQKIGVLALLICQLIDFSIAEPRIVCYYTNWSVYRPGTAKFNPQNINPYLCTHLIYAFGGFTKDNQLKPFDKYQDIEKGGYAKFTGLKTYNKELKTMLAIGGWNEGSTRFSPLVASSERRSQLVKNAIKFLRQNKFDGLDLDWEYPAYRDGGKPKDRENYAKWVQELREEFQREHDKTGRPRLLLTMAVPAGFEYIEKGYDIPKLNKHLDWFNLLSYDYHSAYEPSVNHHAPLYPIEEENEYSYDTDLNINSTINYYVKAGADREKLVLGIPTYGRSYTLFNSDSTEIGAPADGPGEQGDATKEKGYLAYYEICQNLKEEDSDWEVFQPNPDALGPYAVSGNQWVGYDDEDIVRKKSKFVVEQNLGGIMFWSIDNDDFRGLCNGKAYPLIEAAKESYLDGLANGVPKTAVSSSRQQKPKVTTSTKKPSGGRTTTPKFTTPPPPTTPDPTGGDFKCEDEGFFAHPSDCKKYFWCLEAAGLGIVAHQFTCPSGLYFNKQADSCDYTRNVHCEKEKKAEKASTTTTTEEPKTTTRASVSTTARVNPLYKSPSRTTQRTTTVAAYEEPSTEQLELDQEDPKVIKELIDLIKKAGGIDQLEKQLNLQEDGPSIPVNSRNGQTSTTQSSIISKSLYEKIKNRGSLFKPRNNFNGASQPENRIERTESKEKKDTTTTTSTEAPVAANKKYASVNRFSRPNPQSAGIESLPESDAVLIDKPQYTSIRRKPAVKPSVVAENDYNGDSESSSQEESKPAQIDSKKYQTISRLRRPSPKPVEADEDEDESDDDEAEIPSRFGATSTSQKPASKYVNLSRKRVTTTETPEDERIDEVIETTEQPRRRTTVAETTQKTVLKVTNRNLIQSNIQENIQIKDTVKQGNSNSLDEDDSNLIAAPTEPVTENIPFPENIFTTATPVTTPPSAQVTKRLIRTESLSDAFDNDSNDVEETTLINGLSKQNDESLNSIAPRPFSRPSVTRTRAPISSSVNIRQTTTSGTTRRRPTQFRSTTETSSVDNEVLETTSRPLYSYPPGYRGTARFRATSSKSGQYDRDEDGLILGNYRPYDDNRLRSLNLNQRPENESTERTVKETTSRTRLPISRTQPSQASSSRTQISTTRTQPFTTRSTSKSRLFGSTTEAPENEEEITTEQGKDVEAKYRFNLSQGNRPDKIRFELAVGRKIDFGYTPAANKFNKSSDPSKVKVITGPLDKSPLSSRDYTKGNVEEIPLVVTEAVTISSFSTKLNLNQIPLNKSDIESFVRDEDLRTDLPIDETTTRKLRVKPSKIGFFKRPQGEESEEVDDFTTTEATVEENVSSPSPLRPISTGFVQRNQNKSSEAEVKTENESSTNRFKLRAGQTRFPARSTVDTFETSEAPESLTSSRARPFAFQNRFTQKTNEITLENTNDLDSTTTRTRPSSSFRSRQSRPSTSTKASENSQALEDEDEESLVDTTTGRTRPLVQNRFTRPRPSTKPSEDFNDNDDENSGESSIDTTTGKTRLQSAFQNRFSRPKQSDVSISTESTTTVKSRLQSNFQNRFTRPKLTLSKSDSNSEESSIDSTTVKTRLQSALSNRFTRPKTTTKQSDDASSEESSIDSTTGRTRPAAFQNRLSRPKLGTQTADDSNTEESTTSRLRVRPSPTRFGQRSKADVKIEDVNDLATESSLDQVEITKSRYQPKENSRLAIRPNNDLEALDSVTDRNIEDEENENEIDFTTVSSFESNILSNDDDDDETEEENNGEDNKEDNEEDNEISETTIEPLIDTTSTTRRTVVIRKRPVKKIDLVATRQTITEATEEEVAEREDDEDEVKSSTEAAATSPLSVSRTASTRTRPTRRLVNIRKLASDDQASSSVAQPNPTRKRIVLTRRKPAPVVDENPEDEIQISESPEKSEVNENAEESSEKPVENVTRRRVKVFRTRASTTEKAVDDEATTRKRIPSTRTRVYKRPVKTADEEIESEVTPEEEKETTATSQARFGPRKIVKIKLANEEVESEVTPEEEKESTPRARFGPRKIVKVNKKIVDETSSSVQPEVESTSSSQGPKFSRPVYKILRTKTPKFLVDRPLIDDDSSVIKTDDENQEIENKQEFSEEPDNIQESEDEEVQDELSEEPESSARPLLKYPTRPNSANRVVTIKRRPAFNLNTRSTTIHPASTSRFSKESVPTRAKQVTIRRKYKPTSSSADSTVEVDEIEPEKRLKLEAKKKALFAKGYRKSLSTTLAPNITPLTDTETPENDDVVDTTEIPLEINDENILQNTPTKPRFSLSRFTTTTTTRPTTLHHVFAIDAADETGEKINKTIIKENNADEVIKKLQKLIEINRIVEIYSKEERGKLLKNKKWKSVKISELTVEKPPSNSKFGEISRETIIKLVKLNATTTTERPVYNQTREPKNIMFAETVFGQLESSTISLEGLFDREKKSNDDIPEDSKVSQTADVLRAPAPLLRPESNETDPIIISLKSLDQVILSKVQRLGNEREDETTENPSEDTTLVDDN